MRKPRELRDGVYYHVFNQFTRKERNFELMEIADMFGAVIAEAHEKFDFQIVNFVLMPTHYHIIIKPAPKESLSRIMQWILSVFAMRFNSIMDFVGPVWRGRFHSVVIDHIKQFITEIFYVTNNPVKAGIVSKLWDYYHSAYTILTTKNRQWYCTFGFPEQKIWQIKRIISATIKKFTK